ncbi:MULTISPECIES: alpha-D-ribose 1-methylphosphonate 5-triphosphate diphosphatase [Actibacterium]|uniref:Alpha-D-ribose 1-methylphosphonate 5-triphosphate diphosphatase n=1 Tax=Actibacterium naphthalenivorans TaxID=1614693 RepID=A0A840CME9_9RHOB|nr:MULTISPECIES: alpha-D-ribose 1-methylphosphonate 5-triphosphate diphosphatase [Actibacterium]ALG90643.1 phosphonate metabolism protein PhnM [Actibacterium sp. EMB200-NS6]MBB4023177.1 alpha-D-ribose 1-methylphosphonate 5-triphosphate diphosphatase [Actibacterium naphthalenivorans]
MFDHISPASFRLTNARIVTGDRVLQGSVSVEQGLIAELREGPADGIDCGGAYLTPGVVDIHTDHVETHVFPRASVMWDFLNALMAHDMVVIGAGTTTVFDSLSVGASMKRPERREILGPLVEALEQGVARGLFRAEHFLHMRCEISDPDTMALVDANIGRPITRLASVMDHTPGDRQSLDVDHWTERMAREMKLGTEEMAERREELFARSARVGAQVRAHVVAAAAARRLPLMTHDDRTLAHVEQSHAEGIAVSEFPCTVEAAERARALGQIIVAGAPNYLRGGSQSGNVAVAELMAAGLVDVLASDYVPRSPIDAAFAIAEDPALPQDLPQMIAMVSRAPARLAGLTDRGEIAPGQRADLLRIHRRDGRNHIAAVWRGGQRVL